MRFKCLAGLIAAVPIIAHAQQTLSGEPPAPPVASSKVQTKRVTLDEPYSDPGDVTARSLAADEGISLGEAQRRLRLMVEASRSARKLRSDPNFVGMRIVNGADFHVETVFKGSDQAAAVDGGHQLLS